MNYEKLYQASDRCQSWKVCPKGLSVKTMLADLDAALREIEARRYSDVTGTNKIGSTETVYDDTGRRVRITHLDGSDVVLANYEYEFDQANRITRRL